MWGGRELAGELVFFNVMGEEALEFEGVEFVVVVEEVNVGDAQFQFRNVAL